MSKETYFDTGINILVLGATGNGISLSLSEKFKEFVGYFIKVLMIL